MPELPRIGVATRDITPRKWVPGILLAGFDINRKASGILDNLEVGALYIGQHHREVLLVTLDLIGLMKPVVDRIRRVIVERLGRALPVLVSSTHTHSAPDTLGLWGWGPMGVAPLRSGINRDYLDFVVEMTVVAALEAVANAVPAGLKVARMDTPEHWVRNDRAGGIVDRQALCLGVVDQVGGLTAVVVNLAAHPETLWETNTLVSADYPGAFRTRIRQETGAVPLFFSSDLGGMLTPNCPEDADLEQRQGFARGLGRLIADLALERLRHAATVYDISPHWVFAPLVVPVQNARFKLAASLGVLDRGFYLDATMSEAWVIRFGREFAFVACPGELVPELGEALRGRFDVPLFLSGLCCDELGYMLTEHQFSLHEYRYEQSMSCGPEFTRRYMAKIDLLLDLEERDV